MQTCWNRARVKLLARFLVALITCRTVCLTQLANNLAGKAQVGSHYRRLQRFLSGFDLDGLILARLMLKWLAYGRDLNGHYVLALDRTNWKFGNTELNTLMLAVVHNGVGFPLLWTVLGKAGNSSTAERQALLNQDLEAFGSGSIAYLCADREFGGKVFLAWLKQQDIAFAIRLRGNVKITNAKGQVKTARGMFWNSKVGQNQTLGERRVFGGRSLPLHVSGMRLKDGDFLIVASNQAVLSDSGEGLLTAYGRRWGIETMFGCLKRRGFNLEATHLREAERLSRLLSVLALAYTWAYLCGAWLFEHKPWKTKKHNRLPMSLFRGYGS